MSKQNVPPSTIFSSWTSSSAQRKKRKRVDVGSRLHRTMGFGSWRGAVTVGSREYFSTICCCDGSMKSSELSW